MNRTALVISLALALSTSAFAQYNAPAAAPAPAPAAATAANDQAPADTAPASAKKHHAKKHHSASMASDDVTAPTNGDDRKAAAYQKSSRQKSYPSVDHGHVPGDPPIIDHSGDHAAVTPTHTTITVPPSH